ncbi:MAG: aldehyde-activating protein [Martelella sp.]|uniref:GFA family protein n=1 Tax=Martelella sp. TaxID=1969699 RepID=UPI000C36F08E|nr:GFA family protein [Martelella sp.]MAU19609.1 aldehyde-activating protein [Martelella sp.]
MKITGGCYCGKVRFEAEIDPDAVVICHCTDCQRLSGSPYRTTVLVPRADVEITSGVTRSYWKMAESGRKREQFFCENCGSPLFTGGEGGDEEDWGIRWGMIDQRDVLPPKRQIWCRSAVPWLDKVTALPGEATE